MDKFKPLIDAYDHLLSVMEQTDPRQLSALQKADIVVYTTNHLATQVERLAGVSLEHLGRDLASLQRKRQVAARLETLRKQR
jgi:hypothetical protein